MIARAVIVMGLLATQLACVTPRLDQPTKGARRGANADVSYESVRISGPLAGLFANDPETRSHIRAQANGAVSADSGDDDAVLAVVVDAGKEPGATRLTLSTLRDDDTVVTTYVEGVVGSGWDIASVGLLAVGSGAATAGSLLITTPVGLVPSLCLAGCGLGGALGGLGASAVAANVKSANASDLLIVAINEHADALRSRVQRKTAKAAPKTTEPPRTPAKTTAKPTTKTPTPTRTLPPPPKGKAGTAPPELLAAAKAAASVDRYCLSRDLFLEAYRRAPQAKYLYNAAEVAFAADDRNSALSLYGQLQQDYPTFESIADVRARFAELAASLVEGPGTACATPAPLCGDWLVSSRERCDDGNGVDGDGCDHDCSITACGNGIVTAGEDCDDGNGDDLDACSNVCKAAAPPAARDDGGARRVVDPDEEDDEPAPAPKPAPKKKREF